MVRVLSTREFDVWEEILGKVYEKEIKGVIEQLKENMNGGKPLQYPFLREKKIGTYRIYFLVYKKIDTVLLVTISDKKAQQKTIDLIIKELHTYKDLVEHL